MCVCVCACVFVSGWGCVCGVAWGCVGEDKVGVIVFVSGCVCLWAVCMCV